MLAILLGKGSRSRDVESLARELLYRTKGLQGLSRFPSNSLLQIDGIGDAKASIIQACKELSIRIRWCEISQREFTRDSLLSYLKARLFSEVRECFVLVTLSPENHLIRAEIVSKGNLFEVGVHTRDLLQIILNDGAASVAICHNHPKQKSHPSESDWMLFREFRSILSRLDIQLMDQWIFGIDGIFSCEEAKNLSIAS